MTSDNSFQRAKPVRLASADLVRNLIAMEHRPWPEWKNDKPLTQRQLAGLLEPFDIAPTDVWTGKKCLKGSKLSQFEDAFARYLGGRSARTRELVQTKEFSGSSIR